MSTRFIVFICSIFLASPSFVLAQDCPTGDITLRSQEDVDAFINSFPNCTNITRSLIIDEDAAGTAITNLDGFININNINGDLRIQNCQSLRFLDGLFQLEFTGLDSLVIIDNPKPVSYTHLTLPTTPYV